MSATVVRVRLKKPSAHSQGAVRSFERAGRPRYSGWFSCTSARSASLGSGDAWRCWSTRGGGNCTLSSLLSWEPFTPPQARGPIHL